MTDINHIDRRRVQMLAQAIAEALDARNIAEFHVFDKAARPVGALRFSTQFIDGAICKFFGWEPVDPKFVDQYIRDSDMNDHPMGGIIVEQTRRDIDRFIQHEQDIRTSLAKIGISIPEFTAEDVTAATTRFWKQRPNNTEDKKGK
jgi:hypothetical protein